MSPFGFDRQSRAFLGDSKELVAVLYNEENTLLIPQADISSVTFSVMKPGDDPNTPTVDADAGTVTGDGTAVYNVADTVHDVVGEYRAFARFTYDENGLTNKLKTVPMTYEVADVFRTVASTPAEPSMDLAWQKLSDCFDSEFGGPWLRDMTKANFDKVKIADFVPDVLLEINAQQPVTEYNIDSFPWTTRDGAALVGFGLYIATIKHLMRSYTEQPNVMNSSVGYLDRTRYQQAWGAIYQMELPEWKRILELWKRGEIDISRGSLLVGNKAGRLTGMYPRTRFIGRGGLI